MEYSGVKLGDLFDITSGGTPSRKKNEYYEDGDISWVKTGDLKKKYLDKASENITELGIKKSSAKLFPKGTVLLAMYGATIGNCSILSIDAASNQACAAFRPNENVIPEYLYYYLLVNKKYLMDRGVGGAQPNISISILKEIRFPLTSIEEQKKIVTVLDKAQALIEKRKEAIVKLNELIQSVFYDMFGDPISNGKGWKKELFERHLLKIESGWSPKCETFPASEGEWGVLKLSAVTKGGYIPGENKALLKELKPKQEIAVTKGDLLFIRKNTLELVGTSAFVFNTPDFLMMPDTIFRFVLIDNQRLNKIFLWQLFNNIHFKKEVQKLAGGSAGSMPNISKQKLKNMSLIIPDIKLQNEYATFVMEHKKQKNRMEKSLRELEKNFQSLLYNGFKGELKFNVEVTS
ncbi:restriction endonuclease subunit S [Bacillus toyonensis]|uniref:restriction endonuclease subunit S n=1 Tax=Bacillus toyonensis TaxID=155322 RepID=UPI000BFE871E|nr:restriction endonuclease subunit S [Bacillus toyonensis]PHC59980.1 restriction endonuclease subunit S [Bacillus toyonensis]